MPIYEYKCTECQHRLEKLQKMSDDLLKDCPECGQSALTKLVSASSFKLKGSGWYETDFKNNKKSAPSTADQSKSKESKSATQSEPTIKSESKSKSTAK